MDDLNGNKETKATKDHSHQQEMFETAAAATVAAMKRTALIQDGVVAASFYTGILLLKCLVHLTIMEILQ